MKTETKSQIYYALGFLVAAIIFILIIVTFKTTGFLNFVIGIIILLLTAQIVTWDSDSKLIKLIESSSNPRREYWKLFLKRKIQFELLNKIPDQTVFIKEFEPEYLFFDRKTTKYLRLYVSKDKIRFLNTMGKYPTYKFSEIDEVFVYYNMDSDIESPTFPQLGLIIKINKMKEYCDISNIDFNIDELEQVIEHFAQNKFKKTTTGNMR